MPEIGHTISHYMIVERLGAGGMGEVYKARDTRSLRWTIIAHMLTDLLNLPVLAFVNIVVPPSLP